MTFALTNHDLYLFNEGSHFRLYEKLGAHLTTEQGVKGVRFTVWAPNAEHVWVIGDFNNWQPGSHRLEPVQSSGLWTGFVAGLVPGACYKYKIDSHHQGYQVEKADPFAFSAEMPPRTGSIVWPLEYAWKDAEWMKQRTAQQHQEAPVSIYELHVGSWMHAADDASRSLNYRELAPMLAAYVKELGFTHVELMPVMEHPFYASWGYQVTGYFSPTSRYGTPQDFMFLIDTLHQNGIGVILDWVPSHFPTDQHGLAFFDGTHLYEHADARQGFHPDWSSAIFNYGRDEVRSFLISSAVFWLDKYHIDGLRVDGVASMLYLDYSRPEGQWIPNIYGGRENLDAINLLRRMNETVYQLFPGVQTYAEESTSWPQVSRPTFTGGLGFGYKWDMGWMHDMLDYMAKDPIHRVYHHNQLTFRLLYAFHENFVLSLSHDEVVHGKGSLFHRMPGDEWQKFANLRLLFGAMYAHSGKKLIFMGGEFGQKHEWNHNAGLDWFEHQNPFAQGLMSWVRDLNGLYKNEPSLHKGDCSIDGFQWVDCSDSASSIISFLRKGGPDPLLVVFNFTPVPRDHYAIGVPKGGYWKEMLNSDSTYYHGSGMGNNGGVTAHSEAVHGFSHALRLTLPPLSVMFFKPHG